jgi:hypothetical protein
VISLHLFEKEATIVNVANNIVKSLSLDCGGELLVETISDEILEKLGVKGDGFFITIGEEVQLQYQNTIETFLQTAD